MAVPGRLLVLEKDGVAECSKGGKVPLGIEPMEAGSAVPNPAASARDAGEEEDPGRESGGEGTYA